MDKKNVFQKLAVETAQTQSDMLAQRIKGMIVSGELETGFVFPNENEFCKILNVGRGTLREAYKILDTQGFILRTKHGTYIKDRDDIARQGDFKASLLLAKTKELTEFVGALEPSAVYLAVSHIDEEKLAKLERLMISCEEEKNTSRMLDKNHEFHAYLRSLCENHLIISALEAYYDAFDKKIVHPIYHEEESQEKFRQKSLAQHRELYEAIKDGDAQRAKTIMYNHLKSDVDFLVERKL